jgi:hypothetical protein
VHGIIGHEADPVHSPEPPPPDRQSVRLPRDRLPEATVETHPDTGDVVLAWSAADERGRELEIVAVEKPDCFLVIHVMPAYKEQP